MSYNIQIIGSNNITDAVLNSQNGIITNSLDTITNNVIPAPEPEPAPAPEPEPEPAPAPIIECLLPNSSVNIVPNNGNKYVFNNASTYDDTLTYGLYNGTYVINNVPTNHPIAFLNNDVSNVFDYNGTVSKGSLEVSGVNYIFYSGTVTLIVSGDFGNISAYCLYHGYMGAENKFTYTNDCNTNLSYSLSSDVSSAVLPIGYNGTIRLYDNLSYSLDFSFSEINNTTTENSEKELALYIENAEIKIAAINNTYVGRKLGALIFNLYDEVDSLVDSSISPEKISITVSNYQITPTPSNTYFLIEPAPGTLVANYLSLTAEPQVIGTIQD